jgi:hypothetical protein
MWNAWERTEMHVSFSLEFLLLPKENLSRPVSDSHVTNRAITAKRIKK